MEILSILYALPQAVSHYKYSKFLLFGKQLFYFFSTVFYCSIFPMIFV
uniref:Uncharacterized protein n=1 Tax=Myoviridae sp. cth2T2 TaxID=2826683 RepID=A0A8S5MC09_9CAUD|nr:MAG TPA: hypothetical protein [Myoviridae sp. cth2T2]